MAPEFDIVSECPSEPVGKTLAELGVKVGDVVEFVGETKTRSTIQCYEGGHWYSTKQRVGGGATLRDCAVFTIVSRANEPDKPKTWGEMTTGEQNVIAGHHARGGVVEYFNPGEAQWYGIGTPGWKPHYSYRVRIEPVRETVTLTAIIPGIPLIAFCNDGRNVKDTHRITFDSIDGKPDCNSIRMDTLGDD